MGHKGGIHGLASGRANNPGLLSIDPLKAPIGTKEDLSPKKGINGYVAIGSAEDGA